MDMERLKRALWLPLSITEEKAEVIACYPDDPQVRDDIQKTLQVKTIDFKVALPADLIRIIEHNQDLNPGFPPSAGRTPLAKVRTFLADRRSMLSYYRTSLAKGRTGLAFLRTGLSFITIALVLFRIFGIGYLTVVEALLFAAGVVMTIDGMKWYLPARSDREEAAGLLHRRSRPAGRRVLAGVQPRRRRRFLRAARRSPGLKSSASGLEQAFTGDAPQIPGERQDGSCRGTDDPRMLPDAHGAGAHGAFLYAHRDRFYRARHRAAQAVPRRPLGSVDGALIILGALMVAEGFYWYLPGRHAGAEKFAGREELGGQAEHLGRRISVLFKHEML